MYLRNHYQVRNLVLRPLVSSLWPPLVLLEPPLAPLGLPLVLPRPHPHPHPLLSPDSRSVAPSPGRALAEHSPKQMSNDTGTGKDKWMK
jgi:hypothetical protein